VAWERWNDGGLISMVVMGRLVAVASAKVGRRSSMSMSPRMLLLLLDTKECQVEAGESLDWLSAI